MVQQRSTTEQCSTVDWRCQTNLKMLANVNSLETVCLATTKC